MLREAGDVEDLLNRGRMDVMLGQQQSEKWQVLNEGPRRERPEWVTRKLGPTITLPPVKALQSFVDSLTSGVSLPKPDSVWSIAKHEVSGAPVVYPVTTPLYTPLTHCASPCHCNPRSTLPVCVTVRSRTTVPLCAIARVVSLCQ